jgi:hypothetical protein
MPPVVCGKPTMTDEIPEPNHTIPSSRTASVRRGLPPPHYGPITSSPTSHATTKHQRLVAAAVLTCIAGLWGAAALHSQLVAQPNIGSPIHWVTVNADAASRDTNILDAIIRDVLTNQELASTREFYGGVGTRTVRHAGFPPGYQPRLPGYYFEPLPSSNLGSGLKLTLNFSGIWIDQPPPKEAKDNFRKLRPSYPAERGALLSFYNSGGPTTNGNLLTTTMGGCMIGYEIRQITNGWKVGLLGYWDP